MSPVLCDANVKAKTMRLVKSLEQVAVDGMQRNETTDDNASSLRLAFQ